MVVLFFLAKHTMLLTVLNSYGNEIFKIFLNKVKLSCL